MTSKNDIIAKAVETAIQENESIDLLLISQSLDEINGEVVGSDEDYGMHFNYLYIGMSGQRMVDQMNSNWNATDAQFLAHQNQLNIRIISNQIKERKEDNGKISYTTDGETWHSLQAEWGKISGNILEQTDLAEVLANKVNLPDFENLSTQVGNNFNSIIQLQASTESLEDSVSSIFNTLNGTNGVLIRLSAAEQLLAKKISSDTVIEIRTVNDTALEFTTDGTNWHPVASAGVVEWGDIVGDITNQADLQLLFNSINTRIDNVISNISDFNDLINGVQQNLNQHIANETNPHKVTKSQVGLGNVDNTSDNDKPISVAQQQAFDNLNTKIDTDIGAAKTELREDIETAKTELRNENKIIVLTKTEFDNLVEKDNTKFYIISDL